LNRGKHFGPGENPVDENVELNISRLKESYHEIYNDAKDSWISTHVTYEDMRI
jgi:hypothetical protein